MLHYLLFTMHVTINKAKYDFYDFFCSSTFMLAFISASTCLFLGLYKCGGSVTSYFDVHQWSRERSSPCIAMNFASPTQKNRKLTLV